MRSRRSPHARRRHLSLLPLALGALLVAPAGPSAATTRTVIHIPLTVLTNLCNNAELVQLSGDQYITTTTTPRSNGGYTVSASIVAPNLTGSGIVSRVPYRGVDGQQTYSYYAPAPYPSTYDVTLYTVLQPLALIPSEYLVTHIRQTIAFDGTPVTTFQNVQLTCKQPTCSHQRWS
jgi:hypothetical protein